MAGAIKPITGMLKKGLVTDLAIALGIGATMGSLFWHGYHMPRTIARDNFYSALEKERAAKQGQ
ncbi:cytochrome c oxidase family protein [Pestalotiopsis sp. NC0098]|nr:cytochrome c oxidase family protein [Pestalotiopsis sp. NC0098]